MVDVSGGDKVALGARETLWAVRARHACSGAPGCCAPSKYATTLVDLVGSNLVARGLRVARGTASYE